MQPAFVLRVVSDVLRVRVARITYIPACFACISNTGTVHFIMRTVDARMGASVVMQNQIKRHVVLPISPFHYCCPPHNLLKCSKPMRPTTLTANSPPLKNETNPPSCSNGNTTKVLLILCLKAQRSYHQQWYRTSRQKCAETRLAIDLERNFQRNHSDDSYWLWTLPPCTLPPHRGCRPAATHQCKRQSGHSCFTAPDVVCRFLCSVTAALLPQC